MTEAVYRELKREYERALRYSLRYSGRWDRLDEAAERLRAFVKEDANFQQKAA